MLERASNILSDGMEKLANIKRQNDGDYERNGILYCGVCGEAKQAWINWLPDADGNQQKHLVPVICKCELDAYNIQKNREREQKFKFNLNAARERYGIQPRNVELQTFERDDNPDGIIARTCRKYVGEWENMRDNNMGIIFYGPKGTGKSFYAACIANAIAEAQIPTALTTTAHLMGVMQSQWNKADVIDNLNYFRLLVLDDLGTERDTAFGAEVMYSIIDARYRSKLPLIVTTNLDLSDMRSETDMWRSRIYDRVLEMCPITLKMIGESRRAAIADERRNLARDFLRSAGKGVADGD